jgi:taurine--2-oxoglutarate transaminase
LLADKVAAKMMANGVYMQAWVSHFVIAPPLIITEKEIDTGVAAFDEALSVADAEVEN